MSTTNIDHRPVALPAGSVDFDKAFGSRMDSAIAADDRDQRVAAVLDSATAGGTSETNPADRPGYAWRERTTEDLGVTERHQVYVGEEGEKPARATARRTASSRKAAKQTKAPSASQTGASTPADTTADVGGASKE